MDYRTHDYYMKVNENNRQNIINKHTKRNKKGDATQGGNDIVSSQKLIKFVNRNQNLTGSYLQGF